QECLFSFHAKNFLKRDSEKPSNKITGIPRGFVLRQETIRDQKHVQADFAVTLNQANAIIDHCWFRGGWFDSMTMTWRSVEEGETCAALPRRCNAPGASVYFRFTRAPGEQKELIVNPCWHVPDSGACFCQHQSEAEH